RARRVLGHERHIQPLTHSECDRAARLLQHELDRPSLCVLPDRTAADEHHRFDRDAAPLHGVGDRLDISGNRARSTRRTNAHALRADLAAEPDHRVALALARARKPGIEAIDTETLHQMEDLDLPLERRIDDRWALQTVAQGLVVKHHLRARRCAARTAVRPVEDEALTVVAHSLTCSRRRSSSRASLSCFRRETSPKRLLDSPPSSRPSSYSRI